MRDTVLTQPKTSPLILTKNLKTQPYSEAIGTNIIGDREVSKSKFPLAGLGLKTYQSDRLNNWLSTEWIDGANGISALTSIDTSLGSFSMDDFNLMEKLYNVLNRIAVSGGSLYDWYEAVWGDKVSRSCEMPVYCGGLSSEIVFNEVVSTADAGEGNPLGSLAGRGKDAGHKGGRIRIKAKNEPCFIMGIASITPRIDYSQGNKWFNNLETMDDLHKPGMDGIGFQELITDEMAAWDTRVGENGKIYLKSAGKQPAWIQYMTDQNETAGTFAMPNNTMFMTLNRRFEPDENANIKDLTTYIDPTKYNYAFAETNLDAQNFWLQIAMDITARRKMSAKIIPNL